MAVPPPIDYRVAIAAAEGDDVSFGGAGENFLASTIEHQWVVAAAGGETTKRTDGKDVVLITRIGFLIRYRFRSKFVHWS